VVSTTLEGPLDWPDATVVSGDAVDIKGHGPARTRAMITRLWQGWTASEDADAYEQFLLTELFPSMQEIPGFRGAEVLRRPDGGEVAFVTLTRFDSLDAIRARLLLTTTRWRLSSPKRSPCCSTRRASAPLRYRFVPHVISAAVHSLKGSTP
jgi:heme-degrading monooxygenase HmoA